MKRIAIIGTTYPFRGGLAVFNERLAKELQDMGHEVDIYTFSLQYPNFLFPGETQYSSDPRPPDLHIKEAVNSVNPFNWVKVGHMLNEKEYDWVLFKFWLPFMGPCFGTIARLAKRNGKTQVVTILDNVIPHEKRIGDRAFTRYYISSSDAFIAMSRSVLEDLRQFTDTPRAQYIPHPIYDNFGELVSKEEARKWLGVTQEEKLLLFFGIIRKYKGLDLLIEAMADPRIRDQQIRLIVAGEYYADQSYYEDLIDQHQVRDSLILKPEFISNEEVKYYFCGADMVVQPYKTATQSGISQMAYHFERPMLVTKVGGLPEIVPDGVVGYVTEVDVEAIVQAILNFYDENKEAAFTANVREEKKRFEWSVMAEGVIG